MTRRFLTFAGAFAAAALVLSGEAKADFGNFQYVTGVAAQLGAVVPGNPIVGAGPIVVAIGNGNSLTFSGNNSLLPIDSTLPGGANINFGDVAFTPDPTNTTVTPYTVSYNYTVALKDVDGGDIHNFNFVGMIQGLALGGANPAVNGNVMNFSVSPSSIAYLLGTYSALNNGGTGPGSSGGVLTNGTLQGNIQSAVPEPASLTLIGLGGLGLTVLRRRRAAKARTPIQV
jgi:PEP-CTERM motif